MYRRGEVQPRVVFVGGSGEIACLDHAGRLIWHEGFKGLGTGKVALGVPGLVAQGDADSQALSRCAARSPRGRAASAART